MLKLLTSLTCVLLLAPIARAEPEYVLRRSSSEQFTVYGPITTPIHRFKSKRVPLDSALAAVSCERIKQALLRELEGAGRASIPIRFQAAGEGKIFTVLHTRISQPILITPVPTSGALNYRIDLPNQIEAPLFVEAVTETILLEMVNRHSSEHFTQIPRWLTQGLAAKVQEIAPETLVLEPHRPVTRIKTRVDALTEIRRNPTNFVALTFDELSWPEFLPAEKAAHYRENALVFVSELMRLKNGRVSLRQMLQMLPTHSRWQVAFMQAFGSRFQQLVDVDKWWELTVVDLTSGGPGRALPHEQALDRLGAALQVSVEVFRDFSTPPERNSLPLQEVISNWEIERQTPALRRVVNQLRILKSRLKTDVARLADDYLAALENYLREEEKSELLRRALFRGSLADLRQNTRKQLDLLDARRAKLAATPQPLPSTREDAIRSALEIASQRGAKTAAR